LDQHQRHIAQGEIKAIDEYFYSSSGNVVVDSVINLTGFALVGGPASQDHPKAIETRH
jgi:magnesium chelatase subunit H